VSLFILVRIAGFSLLQLANRAAKKDINKMLFFIWLKYVFYFDV